jgi:hypothetical protein
MISTCYSISGDLNIDLALSIIEINKREMTDSEMKKKPSKVVSQDNEIPH